MLHADGEEKMRGRSGGGGGGGTGGGGQGGGGGGGGGGVYIEWGSKSGCNI